MDEDQIQSIESQLDRLEEQLEENTRIIKKIYRAHIISRIITLFYWLLVIGVAIGAFYFIQPYIDAVINAVNGINNTKDTILDGIKSRLEHTSNQ